MRCEVCGSLNLSLHYEPSLTTNAFAYTRVVCNTCGAGTYYYPPIITWKPSYLREVTHEFTMVQG